MSSVLAQLERLDHRVMGMPETDYVFESRKFRMRLAVISLMAFVSLIIAVASDQAAAGWLLVAFAIVTGVKNVVAHRAHRAAAPTGPTGRWYER